MVEVRACTGGAQKEERGAGLMGHQVEEGHGWLGKGEGLTKWKESVIREDPVWMDEGASETNVIFPHFYPTGLADSLSLRARNLCLFLERGRVTDGTLASTLPQSFLLDLHYRQRKQNGSSHGKFLMSLRAVTGFFLGSFCSFIHSTNL